MSDQSPAFLPPPMLCLEVGVSCRENDESLEGSNQEAVKKQSKSSQKVPAALCPGVFYCRLPDVLDSDEYIPAGYN